MKHRCRVSLFSRALCLLAFVLLLSSCAPVEKSIFPKKDIVLTQSEEKNPFEPVMKAFEAGDYEAAKEGFISVLETSVDELIRRKARFGIACTAFAAASDEQELKKALQLWERWAIEAPEFLENEDPRLLHPVLRDYYIQFSSQVKKLKEDCERLKEQRAALGMEKKELQSRLSTMEEENQALEEKIEALQALHDDLLNRRKSLEK